MEFNKQRNKMSCRCIKDNKADECLTMLPGVENACCGHGNRNDSYIMFKNGVLVRGFDVIEYSWMSDKDFKEQIVDKGITVEEIETNSKFKIYNDTISQEEYRQRFLREHPKVCKEAWGVILEIAYDLGVVKMENAETLNEIVSRFEDYLGLDNKREEREVGIKQIDNMPISK